MSEYIDNDMTIFENCCKEANETLLDFLYLMNADQRKYVSVMQLGTAKVPWK